MVRTGVGVAVGTGVGVGLGEAVGTGVGVGVGPGVGVGVGVGFEVGVGLGVTVGVRVGMGVGVRVGVGDGVGDTVGVGVGVGVGDELGVGVGEDVGVGVEFPGVTSSHHVPQSLPVAAYSWSVQRLRSSSGSTPVLLKSPHRLSPVPKSLKYGACPALNTEPARIVPGESAAIRIENPALAYADAENREYPTIASFSLFTPIDGYAKKVAADGSSIRPIC